MSDKKKQMPEEQLDKVSGGMQYVLSEDEYRNKENLINMLEAAILTKDEDPANFFIVKEIVERRRGADK